MPTILVGAPAAVVWEVTTIVLVSMWLGVSFFKHGSIVWTVWLPVRLLLNAVEVKCLFKIPIRRVMGASRCELVWC